jgi:acyl-CoA synthetase (AMP-forming)/AMP-acid ligase II
MSRCPTAAGKIPRSPSPSSTAAPPRWPAQIASAPKPGARALLLFPMGIDCLVAFFGCLYAGIIAVPMMVPRRQSARDASASILADCGPRLALTTASSVRRARRPRRPFQHAGLEWLAVDAPGDEVEADRAARARAATTSPFCNTPRDRPRPPKA